MKTRLILVALFWTACSATKTQTIDGGHGRDDAGHPDGSTGGACTTKYDCPAGQICLSNTCQAPGSTCEADNECPAGQVCNASQACVTGCVDNLDCTAPETCDLLAASCVGTSEVPDSGLTGTPDAGPGTSCTTKYDCSTNEICANNQCETFSASSSCSSNDQCPIGEVCNASQMCQSGCATNQDCSTSQTCDAMTETCVSPMSCSLANPCPQGDDCVNAQCMTATSCTTHHDCPSGLVCFVPSEGQGTCGNCMNDYDCTPYSTNGSFVCSAAGTCLVGASPDAGPPTVDAGPPVDAGTSCGSNNDCPGMEICLNNACVAIDGGPSCQNECTSGTTQCAGNSEEACVLGTNGCLGWNNPTPCGANQICQNGACTSSICSGSGTTTSPCTADCDCTSGLVCDSGSMTCSATCSGTGSETMGSACTLDCDCASLSCDTSTMTCAGGSTTCSSVGSGQSGAMCQTACDCSVPLECINQQCTQPSSGTEGASCDSLNQSSCNSGLTCAILGLSSYCVYDCSGAGTCPSGQLCCNGGFGSDFCCFGSACAQAMMVTSCN